MPVFNPDDYNAASGGNHGGVGSSNPDAVSFDEVAYKLSVLYPFNPLGEGFGGRDNVENYPISSHPSPGAAQHIQQQQSQQQNGYRQNGFRQNGVGGSMTQQPFHYNAGAMPPNGPANGDPRRAGPRSLPVEGGVAVDPVEDGYSPRQHGKKPNTTECVRVPSSEHVAEIVGRQGKGGHPFPLPLCLSVCWSGMILMPRGIPLGGFLTRCDKAGFLTRCD